MPRTQLRQHLTASFAEVAEFQRSVVHLQGLVPLDGAGDNYPPPATDVRDRQAITPASSAAAPNPRSTSTRSPTRWPLEARQ